MAGEHSLMCLVVDTAILELLARAPVHVGSSQHGSCILRVGTQRQEVETDHFPKPGPETGHFHH